MPDAAEEPLRALAALGVAAAIGFLIGFEREWTRRAEGRDGGFAGARTFTLVAFLGGLSGLFEGPALPATAFALVGGLTIVAYAAQAHGPDRHVGATTEAALLAAFLLGLASARGMQLEAVVSAVAVAIVLNIKDEIVRIAGALDEREVHATLRLLLVSALILPVLPDQGYGPYQALNPQSLWKLVVLISGLSFAGYWLTRWVGSGKGVLLTGLVGGLASSTATTIALARRARADADAAAMFASGVVVANIMMLVRVGGILGALNPQALAAAAPPLAAAGLVGSAGAFALWRVGKRDARVDALELGNPFELRPALAFAVVLGVVTLASASALETFGAMGLYVVALVSGLADVDAITLAAGKDAARGAIAPGAAAGAAMIAASANTLVKSVICFSASRALGWRVSAALGAAVAAGAAAYAVF